MNINRHLKRENKRLREDNERLLIENHKLKGAVDAIVNTNIRVSELKMNEGKMNALLRHPILALLAEHLHECFVDCGGKNYVEFELQAKEAHYVLTLQNKNGKTPHKLKVEAEEKLARLEPLHKGAAE